ncbi:Endoribonuclease Dicer, partial [Mortierella sp. NVP85]
PLFLTLNLHPCTTVPMAAIQTPYQVAAADLGVQEFVGGCFIKTVLGIDAFLRHKEADSYQLTRIRASAYMVLKPTKKAKKWTKRAVGLHILSSQLNRAFHRLAAVHPFPGINSWRDLAALNHVEQAAAEPATHRHLEHTVAQVEKMIGYCFRNKNLLAQALRPENAERRYWETTNDRLEYLGDAVLETCAPLFWIEQDIDLKTLGGYTMASVCNAALQAVMLEVGLDAYLIGATADQLGDIAKAREEYEVARENNPDGVFWKDTYLSKTLADAMEAIFGAVYLDSGMSFREIYSLFERLHWPVVGRRMSAPPEL